MHPAPPSPTYLSRQRQRVDDLEAALRQIGAQRTQITLEIGSGHGHYLTGYAQANPDRYCVGIDIMLDRHIRSERKRTRAAVPNLLFLRASAEDFLAALPKTLLLDDVLVLFPDPWPKRRHHKNRLIQEPFLSELAGRCSSTARLLFRTDHEDYFSWARQRVSEHPAWQLDVAAAWPFELPTVFQTRAANYQSFIAVRRSTSRATALATS